MARLNWANDTARRRAHGPAESVNGELNRGALAALGARHPMPGPSKKAMSADADRAVAEYIAAGREIKSRAVICPKCSHGGLISPTIPPGAVLKCTSCKTRFAIGDSVPRVTEKICEGAPDGVP